MDQAKSAGLPSPNHFTVDGTVIEAWASQKSFAPKNRNNAKRERRKLRQNRNKTVNFHGERRSNDTHASTTDPDACLVGGKGKESRRACREQVLTENRNGLVIDARLTIASGSAEREATLEMSERVPGVRRATIAADKGCDTRDFVDGVRDLGITPHIAQNTNRRRSAIDGRTTRPRGYVVSRRVRERAEEVWRIH